MRATSEEIAIFVAVVESGSFSRAAEQLGQANSAVSRAVKKLESKLGVSLLNRTTRQLSLTEEGERYFRRMQVVLQEICRQPGGQEAGIKARRKPAQSDHPPAQSDRGRRALFSPDAGGLAGNGGSRE
ncbi:DNA-binding transcriptional LysR family regulator [Klebsiella sp. SORGH_AS 826]|nr:DNA-binding transcriptional LysR family regulator [Klebsiella sp. SORGH_AS_0826]